MTDSATRAYALLNDWKKGSYIFGLGVMNQLGDLVKKFGNRALVVGTGRILIGRRKQ